MRVLLVDDNRLMLEGLQNLLEAHDIEVAGIALDGFKSVEMVRKLNPDLILMDIRMPRCDGLTATRLITAENQGAKIIILTTSTEDQDLFEAVKSGAYGYLLKSIDSEELLDALIQVQEGIPPFSPGLAAKLLNEFVRLGNHSETNASSISGEISEPDGLGEDNLSGELTQRQIDVLKLVADGFSYKEAGARLNLSPRTIKYHMAEIMERLHLDNRAQVVAYAGKMGLKPKNNDF